MDHESLGLGGHGLRLGAVGPAAPEADLSTRAPRELLADAARRGLDHGGGRVQDAPAGAIVALEADQCRLGELALEVAQVLGGGAAEAVDRLVVVPDHGDVALVLHEQPQQHSLGEVRVLVLVHQHVPEAPPCPLAHVRLLVEEAEGAQDQVAEVQGAPLGEQAVVVRVQVRELELARGRAAGRVVLRLLAQALGIGAVVARRDHLVLQAVDPAHEAG